MSTSETNAPQGKAEQLLDIAVFACMLDDDYAPEVLLADLTRVLRSADLRQATSEEWRPIVTAQRDLLEAALALRDAGRRLRRVVRPIVLEDAGRASSSTHPA